MVYRALELLNGLEGRKNQYIISYLNNLQEAM